MARNRPLGLLLGVAAGFLVGALLLALWIHGDEDPPPRESTALDVASRGTPAPAADASAPALVDESLDGAPDGFESLFGLDDPARAWAKVDLDALRDELPDNAFWTLATPTQDPTLLAERKAMRDEQNLAWGRIVANHAEPAEIRDFYLGQEQISQDLVTFTTRLLDDYGEALPDRDRGLVELSRRMHRQRLEEIPRRLQEALDRRTAHAEAREAWLRDEALFQ